MGVFSTLTKRRLSVPRLRSLRVILNAGIKVTVVGSINDQVRPPQVLQLFISRSERKTFRLSPSTLRSSRASRIRRSCELRSSTRTRFKNRTFSQTSSCSPLGYATRACLITTSSTISRKRSQELSRAWVIRRSMKKKRSSSECLLPRFIEGQVA